MKILPQRLLVGSPARPAPASSVTFNDPNSKVSQVLQNNPSYRLRETRRNQPCGGNIPPNGTASVEGMT
ncbi:MAG: hypothetical protein IPJ47_22895 [Anaerolineales bacterium]|nr:hypothetical protein [Anaerolineales bacterium]